VAELDRVEPEEETAVGPSCSRFLEERLHLTPAQACGQVRTARRLGELAQTSRAFGHGEVSAAHSTLDKGYRPPTGWHVGPEASGG
jgi:hypothetical protein